LIKNEFAEIFKNQGFGGVLRLASIKLVIAKLKVDQFKIFKKLEESTLKLLIFCDHFISIVQEKSVSKPACS
jgi:hypothetical protein